MTCRRHGSRELIVRHRESGRRTFGTFLGIDRTDNNDPDERETRGPLSDDRTVRAILTPDQRVRVFVSSTMEELAAERAAVREAVDRLRLSPVLFELGARAHPPRSLYRSYLEQSHVFVGIYWQRYGWIAPAMDVSGLEDEYLLAQAKPKLMYVKRPASEREERLEGLLDRIRSDDDVSYKGFSSPGELEELVAADLALLLSEAFLVEAEPGTPTSPHRFTLPGDATTFLGRTTELAQLHTVIERDDVQLVTLTGPGGIGKTRLALRAAAEVAAGYEEGAAFVSLASLRDPESVLGAIASAVGLRDSSGITIDALRTDLADRSLLLVLDNFEHVMSAAELLPSLLRDARRMKVLVTSREALRIQAEHEFPVPPLAPADGVRMFAERANAVRPGFIVDEANAALVERICRRLDDVPLAIELAAARTKLLSLAAILERLEHRLDFLVSGPRDLPERQQALRSTIEWSYDLLDEAERDLFACLGIFVGSFSLAAVEAVGSERADDRDVLDLLASLVDKSLLRVEATAGEPRFRMLGMIADFARSQLAEIDDAVRVGQQHAEHYRDVSLQIGEGVRGPHQREWLLALGGEDGGEAGNLRAALAWFVEHGQLDAFAEMAWALWVPAWINGRIEEGRSLSRAALDREGQLSPQSRARLLVISGTFGMWSGDHSGAMASLDAGRDLAQSLRDDEAVAASVLASSMIVGPSQGEARAEQLARDALQMYERLGDLWGEAAALNALGWLYVAQERFDGAHELFERTLSRSLSAGDEQFSAMAEVNLAEYHLDRGDPAAATDLLASCVQRHRSLRLMYSVAYLLEAAARLASHGGDTRRATRLIGAASQLREGAGVSVWGSQLERRAHFVDELSAALGPSDFADAIEAGTQLCYADALDEVPRPD
jgi:predicted ATPase